jgi:hypothetical protein
MLPDAKLTELGERILDTLWKTGSVGGNAMKEETLKAELASAGIQQDMSGEIAALKTQGFVTTAEGDTALSLTALGISILRQIEEDKLQELK